MHIATCSLKLLIIHTVTGTLMEQSLADVWDSNIAKKHIHLLKDQTAKSYLFMTVASHELQLPQISVSDYFSLDVISKYKIIVRCIFHINNLNLKVTASEAM